MKSGDPHVGPPFFFRHAPALSSNQGSMLDLRRTPSPPLSTFIDMLWYIQAGPGLHAKERLLPTGTIELVVPLNEERSRFYDPENLDQFTEHNSPLLLGAQSGCVVIDASHEAPVVGVHFRPGGAFPFLGLPASEVENQSLSLEDIWGRNARRLRERILAAPGPHEKLDVLEQTLLARLGAPQQHPAIAFALSELSRARKVSDIVDQIGISSRRFIQLFHDSVGLTPKVFSRVRRFQDTIVSIGNGRKVDWAALAADCGYYDQPHFNHEFRSFSGLSPERYLVERTGQPNHVAL
jgi:AraC-like DNA-binding protein